MGQPFSMPMYKDWFPTRLRPWCYILMIVIFQLTSGLYLGNVALMVGENGIMREDVMFIGMCTIVAVNMPFPFLFKFKFRFSNNRLLLNATAMMLICNAACIYVRSVPLLCVLAFVEGFFKPCATFECFSNIQLWMTSKRDMRIFFPLLFLIIAGAMSLQSWLAVHIAYTFDNWRMVHWFMIALLLLCLIFQASCLRRYYIMRIPFKSADWLGLILWSLLFCGICWLFTYGEYYNWTQSKTWCDVSVIVFVILLLTIGRMLNIRHPYIIPQVFLRGKLYLIILCFFIGEWFASTPKVLGTTYVGAIMHWGALTTSVLDLYVLLGVAIGSTLALTWMKLWHMSYTRLGILAFISLLGYQAMMYFLLSPQTNIQALYLPMVLRGFGYVTILVVSTIWLFDSYNIQTFFMALTFTGIVRNGPADCVVNGIYEFFLRRQELSSLTLGQVANHMDTTLIALKEIFGATCIIEFLILSLFLLFDAPPRRLFKPFHIHLHREPKTLTPQGRRQARA